ncbi:MAG: hypothetical protein A3H27_04490 [Acidobacteria bacterium RIFCSPLOWO2_02_FULL_59_13]|nr:MAG: hypothetical protein A3H27_04490 [Acidobacteria bacterium RIFCSPLOWO2_02_FULL_59_13]
MNPTDDFGTLYRQMTEEELLELAAQSATLTEPARWALRAELSSRGIAEDAVGTKEAVQERLAGGESGDLSGGKLSCVFSSNDAMEAQLVQGLLQAAGIESVLYSRAVPGIFPLLGKIDVLVSETKAGEALRIIAEIEENPPQDED